MASKTGLPWLKGTPLLTAITTVCSSAFLLFGYDQGVMSGVVISKYWLEQMGNPSTVMVGTITALYDVGAVFGAILAAISAEKLGRKRALMFGSVLLIIGCVLMGACVERIMMMFGRVFTGFGMNLSFWRLGWTCHALTIVQASATSHPSPPSTNPKSVYRISADGTSHASSRRCYSAYCCRTGSTTPSTSTRARSSGGFHCFFRSSSLSTS
jgi:MFS family permease